MSLKEQLGRNGLKVVNAVGKRYYPNQKDRLDWLRERDYALLVFDALRYDYAKEILPLYLEGEIEPIWSEGHDTFQYGQSCWSDGTYDDWYISGAVPFNDSQAFEDDFLQDLYEGWHPPEHLPNLVEAFTECWDASLGTCDPAQLSTYALDYLDKTKLVVHYFQPHSPYIGDYELLGYTNEKSARPMEGDPIDKPIWERIKAGEISTDKLRLAYRSNVHRVVESALPLIEQLCEQDRKVIIMGDHGELLGRLGKDVVAHPRISFPQIRRVPWMEVTGVRTGAHSTANEGGNENETNPADDIAGQLAALGYK